MTQLPPKSISLKPVGNMRDWRKSHLVSTASKPAARGEEQAALRPCSHVGQLEVSITVHPGTAYNDVVGFAVGRHQGVDFARLSELDPGPAYTTQHVTFSGLRRRVLCCKLQSSCSNQKAIAPYFCNAACICVWSSCFHLH